MAQIARKLPFIFYGQGSYTIFLRQWREITILLATQRPANPTFVAIAQKKKFVYNSNPLNISSTDMSILI